MNLKEILYKEIDENKLLRDELGELVEKTITKTVSKEETVVSREMVLDYLKSRGMQATQKNYEQANLYLQSKIVSTGLDGEMEVSYTETEYINHLKEFSEDDMKTLIDICILRKLQEIDEKMPKELIYEYAVETIQDKGGSTDVETLFLRE